MCKLLRFGKRSQKQKGKKPQTADQKYPCRCGHISTQIVLLNVFDEVRTIELPLRDGKLDFCRDCLEAMVYQCPECRHAIWFDEPVFIGEIENNARAKTGKFFFDEDRNGYMFCYRHKKHLIDYHGFYMVPGLVNHVYYIEGLDHYFKYRSGGSEPVFSEAYIRNHPSG